MSVVRNDGKTSYFNKNIFPLKRDRITRGLFALTLMLLLLILPLGFINEKAGRVFFYWCSYSSAAGILINIRQIKAMFTHSKIVLPSLSLAVLFTIWSFFAIKFAVPDAANGILFTPAKRWFLGSLIALFVSWGARQEFFSRKLLCQLAWASLLTTFLSSSLYGLWQHFDGVVRVTLGINRATMSAYAYSAMALATIAILSQLKSAPVRYISIFLSFLVSLYVTFLSETRSAMVIHTLLSFMLLTNILWRDKKLKLVPVLLILASVTAVLGMSRDIISSRLDTTQSELSRYEQGNDNSSLGSRFTMWHMGLVTFAEHPMGETQITRNEIIRDRLGNITPRPYALEFIDVHLHNEFIQYASLFGVFGIIVLAAFYINLIFFNGTKTSFINPITLVALSALLYGMTDVLLTSVEYIALISALITLLKLYNNKQPGEI